LFRWLKRSPSADTIQGLYGAIVAQARKPGFYADYGVADTPEGRFDMILLHLILFVRRLRPETAPIRALGQRVFDLFCRDMDHIFREMGIGDLAVRKHMRRVAEAFYGRAAAYDAAIEGGDEQLTAVLTRNIFPQTASPSEGAAFGSVCARRDRRTGPPRGRSLCASARQLSRSCPDRRARIRCEEHR